MKEGQTEVFVVVQNKNVDIWLLTTTKEGYCRKSTCIPAQYEMDVRFWLRQEEHLKKMRIERNEWPVEITSDFDFNRHQKEIDKLATFEDGEYYDDYCTKIYKVT